MRKLLILFLFLATACSRPSIDSALRARADAGDAEAQYEIGEQLSSIDYDMDEILKWWRRSADNGYWVAQLRIGNHYSDNKNHELGWKYTQMAAEQGSIDGINNLGFMQWGQTGMPENMREALKWYCISERMSGKESHNVTVLKRKVNPADIQYAEGEAAKWIEEHPNITLKPSR